MLNVDVLCIGTAVVDIAAFGMPGMDKWQEKQRISKIEMMTGGDAANQSIRLADAGRSVMICASVGNDSNGIFLRSVLRDRNVLTDFVSVKHTIQTGTAMVLVDQSGNRNTFSVKGAHSELHKTELPDLKSFYTKALSIASLFSLPLIEEDGLLDYLIQAKNRKIITFADLGSDKKNQGLSGIQQFLTYIDYFLPSDYDAMKITKTGTVEDAADVLIRSGCKNVIIKCGALGCYYKNLEESGWVQAESVEPVDTTGAGDCMVAMFIDAILDGSDLRRSCEYAVRVATESTLYPGASVHPVTRK